MKKIHLYIVFAAIAIAIGRELRMVELKQEVNALCEQLAQAPRYGNSS